MTTVEQVLSSVRISEVYRALTGTRAHAIGRGRYRGAATWRGGDNTEGVSMDDERGVWNDFVTNEGGGILDLVVKVQGGSKQDALKWLAGYAGVPLDDKPLNQEERQKWAEDRQQTERYLPLALLWRRVAVRFVDELLDRHKGALVNPNLPQPRVNEIFDTEYLLRRLEQIQGSDLIEEFLWWQKQYPGITYALIVEARRSEQREQAALKRFIREMPSDVSTTGH